ncbi:MAG: hypothetical protein J5787_07910 [Alphaproteobacteria bacterium]|nr:hypothetical protein [Alphaproteobacteria bacterium]MBO4643119.1 hypothetical protein [Alphaproteobacteria bacterium]
MIFAVFLPLVAAIYIFGAAFFKKRTFAWEVGTAAIAVAFFKIVTMAFKSFFHGRVYSVFLLPFLKLDNVEYGWRLHLEATEIFLVVFIVFSALMSLLFVRNFLPKPRMNRFVVFLLLLLFFLMIGIGAKSVFQFFVGWDLAVLSAYLLLMLFHEKQAVRQSGINFLIWHTLTDVPLFCAFYMLTEKTGTFFIPPFIDQWFTAFQGGQAVVFAVLILLGVSAKLFLFGTNIMITQTAGISVPALAFIAPAALGGLGVYILYICFPFVEKEQAVRMLFTCWGILTAVSGLMMAAAQTNIKIMLCLLLMGQFGFVLTVLGLIGRDAAFCAYIALITPMTGLILCSGTIIRALQGEEDLLRMGGLKKQLPFSFWLTLLFSVCCGGFPQIGNSGVIWKMFAVLKERFSTAGVAGLTFYLFCLMFVFARLLFLAFLAESKLSPSVTEKITQPSKTEALPLIVLLLLSFFQNKVFELSVLPNLSGDLPAGMLSFLLVGACGLPAGILFFKKREKETPRLSTDRAFYRCCLKGFYLTDFYQIVFIRPFMALADFAWRFAGSELLTETLPNALKKTAEKLQQTYSGRSSDFFIWSLAGLFILIFSLLPLLAGG